MKLTQLSENSALVWHLDCCDINIDKALNLLSEQEIERANRFYFSHDRDSYISAHFLARVMLASSTGIAPDKIEFVTGEFGKPEILLPKNAPRIRINLSHTRYMVNVGLTVDHDIGVDIEWLGRKDSCLDLTKSVFTTEEQNLIEQSKDHERKTLFFRLWTLKEAYIKAIGKGLSLPLSDFYFELDPIKIVFKKCHEPNAKNSQWSFLGYRPGPEHLAAVGIRRNKHEKITTCSQSADLKLLHNFLRN